MLLLGGSGGALPGNFINLGSLRLLLVAFWDPRMLVAERLLHVEINLA